MFLDLMRDKSKQMPVIADPLAVESMRIWHCGYKTIEPIAKFKNLRALAIATLPDSGLDALAALKKLQILKVLHLPKVDNIQPLGKLTGLESLELAVLPSWGASKRTVIASLEPLAKIAGLKHLALLGVVSNDRSLAALERCTSLVSAIFHGYPKQEVARFFAATGIQNAHNPPFPAG